MFTVLFCIGLMLLFTLLGSICGWFYPFERKLQALGDLTLEVSPEGISLAIDAMHESNHEFPFDYYLDLAIEQTINEYFRDLTVTVSKVVDNTGTAIFYTEKDGVPIGTCKITVQPVIDTDTHGDVSFILHLSSYVSTPAGVLV